MYVLSYQVCWYVHMYITLWYVHVLTFRGLFRGRFRGTCMYLDVRAHISMKVVCAGTLCWMPSMYPTYPDLISSPPVFYFALAHLYQNVHANWSIWITHTSEKCTEAQDLNSIDNIERVCFSMKMKCVVNLPILILPNSFFVFYIFAFLLTRRTQNGFKTLTTTRFFHLKTFNF